MSPLTVLIAAFSASFPPSWSKPFLYCIPRRYMSELHPSTPSMLFEVQGLPHITMLILSVETLLTLVAIKPASEQTM